MKKLLALLLVCAMVFALAACTSGNNGDVDNDAETGAPDGAKEIRIGVFEPSTGDSGAGGKQEILGMQYANKETPTVEIGGDESA